MSRSGIYTEIDVPRVRWQYRAAWKDGVEHSAIVYTVHRPEGWAYYARGNGAVPFQFRTPEAAQDACDSLWLGEAPQLDDDQALAELQARVDAIKAAASTPRLLKQIEDAAHCRVAHVGFELRRGSPDSAVRVIEQLEDATRQLRAPKRRNTPSPLPATLTRPGTSAAAGMSTAAALSSSCT